MDEFGIYERDSTYFSHYHRESLSGPERADISPPPPPKNTVDPRVASAHLGVIPHAGPLHPRFSSVAARLKTFEHWPPALKQKPSVMAEAGFIYLGLSDKVKCFYCDRGLNEWGEEDDPWVEHAGWFTDCAFIRLTKGDQYVEECNQFVNMTVENRRAAMRNKSSVPPENDSPVCVKKPSTEKRKISIRASSSDIVLQDVNNEALLDENTKLKEQKMCKICMDAEVGVVFLPCGHLVVCANCAPSLKTCAVCRSVIQGTVRTYLS